MYFHMGYKCIPSSWCA